MARGGVSETQIRQAIKALEARGLSATVSAIRDQLGTGSFSTISAVLSSWKEERVRTAQRTVPEAPPDVAALFKQLWTDAFRSADALADSERSRSAQEKLALEKTASEMSAEIARLEETLATSQAEVEKLRKTLEARDDELRRSQVEQVRAQSAFRAVSEELTALRGTFAKAQEQLPGWIERATRAEAKLERQLSANEKKK